MPGGIVTVDKICFAMRNKIKNAHRAILLPDGGGYIESYQENATTVTVRPLEWKSQNELDGKIEALLRNQKYKPPKETDLDKMVRIKQQ